jgi:hypothetical protein
VRVIFLDFDGVLNSHAWMRADSKRAEREGTGVMGLDPSAVSRLNWIVRETGAVVVVSSSWRYGRSVEELKGILERVGFYGVVLDKTADWSRDESRGIYVEQERGDEIASWLHGRPEVESFVVLDDDSDMTAVQDRHVKTSFAGGLLDEHVERAIQMLGSEVRTF